jgi:hypothetical protein
MNSSITLVIDPDRDVADAIAIRLHKLGDDMISAISDLEFDSHSDPPHNLSVHL